MYDGAGDEGATTGGRGPLVLVADDSPTLLKVVGGVLERGGYRVMTAADGVNCVQAFYASRPDLLITDISMPKLSGYLVCRLLKDDWTAANVPVLMLTGRDASADRFWALESGAEAFVTKDFGPDELLDIVTRLIVGREPDYLSPDVGPVTLTESDVLTRVCETLDRKLFESTLVKQIGEVGARMTDFGDTVDAVLSIVGNVLHYSVGCVALAEEGLYALRPVGPVGRSLLLDVVAQVSAEMPTEMRPVTPPEPRLITFESAGSVVEDASVTLQTFVSMPLWSAGRPFAMLGLASTDPAAFGDEDLAALRLIENTLAAVIDNARLHEQMARNGAVRGG